MSEALSGAQFAFAVPTADIDRHAAFDRRSGHAATPHTIPVLTFTLAAMLWALVPRHVGRPPMLLKPGQVSLD